MNQHLVKAVEASGGRSNLAKALGVSTVFINDMIHGKKPVPASRCIAIERVTDGAVTRYELRPDVFGEAPAGKNKGAA